MNKRNSTIKGIMWIISLWIWEALSEVMTLSINLEQWVGIGKKVEPLF